MAKKFFWLTASFVLMLCSCGGGGNSGSSLKVGSDRSSVVWDEDPAAVQYEISVDGTIRKLTSDLSYPLSGPAGEHTIIVKSVDNNGNRGSGSSFTYLAKESKLGDLSYADGKITWSMADSYGLLYKIDNGEYQPVVGDFIEASTDGLYTVLAPSKITDDNVFYCTTVSKIIAVGDVVNECIIEDASVEDDASLSENYRKYKYLNNGWQTAGVSVSLDTSSGAYIHGNAAQFGIKYWGSYFMFEKDIVIANCFNELSFSVKSGADMDFYLAFQVKQQLIIGGLNLTGVYITYPVDPSPTEWTHYRVSLNDPKWKVTFNNYKLSFEDA